MKACHITICHTERDIRIYHKQCNALKESGFEVVLLAPGKTDASEGKLTIKVLPAARRRLGHLTLDLLTRVSISALYRALKVKADVYHLHDPHLLFVGLALGLLGKRVIYDAHEYVGGQILQRSGSQKKRQLQSRMFNAFEILSCRLFCLVIGATPSISRRFESAGLPTLTINNYPILDEFSNVGKCDDDRPAVCYAGYVSEIRGVREMIEGCARAQTNLYIAGKFESVTTRNLCMTLPGWECVTDYGELSRKDVVELYKRSFAGLLLYHPAPNHNEAQPNKLFEYMAAGLPVIASDFPYWRSLVEEHECGILVNPKDSTAISNAILYLKENPDVARKMGERGAIAARNFYSWAAEAKKLTDAYITMLNAHSRI